MREQLDASGMHAGQHLERGAGIELPDDVGGEGDPDIEPPRSRSSRRRSCRREVDEPDVGEPLGTHQLLG